MAYEHPGPAQLRELLSEIPSDELWEVVAEYELERTLPDGDHQSVHLEIAYDPRHGYRVEAMDIEDPDRQALGDPDPDLKVAISNVHTHWAELDR
jgi:hypothetical protein